MSERETYHDRGGRGGIRESFVIRIKERRRVILHPKVDPAPFSDDPRERRTWSRFRSEARLLLHHLSLDDRAAKPVQA